jgi:hypothetical protein
MKTHSTVTTTPQPEYASRSTALSIVWEIVSNKSSGSLKEGTSKPSSVQSSENRGMLLRLGKENENQKRVTYKSGSHSPSATPNNFSEAVPDTTKSFDDLVSQQITAKLTAKYTFA